ncbi:MAG TPA: 4a-hydroxytetrahydrobiopterin dehydratase [Acidimicrobiia bacterium]|jgi:4a-hydroxytetrahydrobiopterin dehydratase
MPLAGKQEVATFLDENRHWRQNGESLVAEFKFKDFNEAMGFVNRVAMAAEAANHHPDIEVRWNQVRLVLTTHSAGGITEKDFKLATRIMSYV